jgi:hypothetical protein
MTRTASSHVTLIADTGHLLSVAVCGLCSALIEIGNDGELRHRTQEPC